MSILNLREWKYNEDGDEMETADEVEKKAVKFLQERGFIIDNN